MFCFCFSAAKVTFSWFAFVFLFESGMKNSLFLPKIRHMERCSILFGSNMGDKDFIFAEACRHIINRCGALVGMSSAYVSEPWGFVADEWFLNRLVVIDTSFEPEELMHHLLEIEMKLGRIRNTQSDGYASRPIDLDIMYYGSRAVCTDDLTLPHPRLHMRRFALLPLCEVMPDFSHPVLGQTQTELLANCPDKSVVYKK